MKRFTFGLLFALTLLCTPGYAYAQIPSGIPVGGMVTGVFPCTCTGGMAVKIAGVPPGVYLIQPGFTIPFPFLFYFPHPGAFALGSIVPGGVCASAAACTPIPVMGTFTLFGTSL